MKAKMIALPLVVVAVVAGLSWYLLRPQSAALGSAAADQVAVTKIGDLTAAQAGQTVAIEGTIAKECPSSGCWAVIQDDTGEIRIDTEKGGFALPLRREGSRIKVIGELQQAEGGQLEISAESAEL
ncbi:MAG TPA: hypothetical protein DEP45_06230 [Armatimonadetes bacterium]|nr:hypothetical protein [Armatimonadota bacterium]